MEASAPPRAPDRSWRVEFLSGPVARIPAESPKSVDRAPGSGRRHEPRQTEFELQGQSREKVSVGFVARRRQATYTRLHESYGQDQEVVRGRKEVLSSS